MTAQPPIKHLLGIKGLNASHIQTIFETADNFKTFLIQRKKGGNPHRYGK